MKRSSFQPGWRDEHRRVQMPMGITFTQMRHRHVDVTALAGQQARSLKSNKTNLLKLRTISKIKEGRRKQRRLSDRIRCMLRKENEARERQRNRKRQFAEMNQVHDYSTSSNSSEVQPPAYIPVDRMKKPETVQDYRDQIAMVMNLSEEKRNLKAAIDMATIRLKNLKRSSDQSGQMQNALKEVVQSLEKLIDERSQLLTNSAFSDSDLESD